MDREEARRLALEFAMELQGRHGLDPEEVINTAKKFEAYLTLRAEAAE
jgi:hypothetical protein